MPEITNEPGKSGRPVYLSRRMAALVGLGFASGLPGVSGLLSSPLQAWLGDLNVSEERIGQLTGLVGLPLAYKFAWAPLLDRVPPPGVLGKLGRRRGWLVLTQALLAVMVGALALLGPTEAGASLWPLAVLGFGVAVLSATQDIVADAYRAEVLEDRELGAGAAVFVNGYRIAMVVGSGGVLLLAPTFGWRGAYGVMALLMAGSVVVTLLSPPSPEMATGAQGWRETLTEPVAEFFRRHGWAQALVILALIILFKLPDAAAKAMTVPLLQKELGFKLTEIAWIREWFGMVIAMTGAVAGGAVVAKMGLRPALWVLGLAQMLSNFGFCLLILMGRDVPVLAAVVAVESFCGGMVTAGFIAFLMAQCNRQHTATQYALFTSLNFATAALSAIVSGSMVKWMGYGWFFAVTVALGLPGVLLLLAVRRTVRPV
ncbi:MAG: MFS transporter [Phycisphaeraceae bacterium]|nr:MFS transporter [Phycisphaeraceae bacterium]